MAKVKEEEALETIGETPAPPPARRPTVKKEELPQHTERDLVVKVRIQVPGGQMSETHFFIGRDASGAMPLARQTVERYLSMIERGLVLGLGKKVKRV